KNWLPVCASKPTPLRQLPPGCMTNFGLTMSPIWKNTPPVRTTHPCYSQLPLPDLPGGKTAATLPSRKDHVPSLQPHRCRQAPYHLPGPPLDHTGRNVALPATKWIRRPAFRCVNSLTNPFFFTPTLSCAPFSKTKI